MDSLTSQPNVDLSKLSDADKRELQTNLSNEMQKAKLQENIHNLTDTCWTKCITGSIKSAKLDRTEETCAQNCVERFLDAQETVLRHLNQMRGGQGM